MDCSSSGYGEKGAGKTRSVVWKMMSFGHGIQITGENGEVEAVSILSMRNRQLIKSCHGFRHQANMIIVSVLVYKSNDSRMEGERE
jgi:hypothetical protein